MKLVLIFLLLPMCWAMQDDLSYKKLLAKEYIPFWEKTFKQEKITLKDKSQLNFYTNTIDNPKNIILFIPGRGEPAIKSFEIAKDIFLKQNKYIYLDIPGQGFSSRLLEDQQRGHIDTYDRYIDALNELIQIQVPKNKKIIIIAHSTGGLISLLYAKKHTEKIQHMILTAPFLDFNLPSPVLFILKPIIKLFNIFGFGHNYFFAQGPYDREASFEDNQVTFSKKRYKYIREFTQRYPKSLIGGPTFNWIYQSLKVHKSLDKKISLPFNVYMAKNDTVVKNSTLKKFCTSNPSCKFKILSPSKHEIFMETDPIRNIVIADILQITN